MSSATPRLLLATDLDGTMALGDSRTREHLASLLRNHSDATLIYVTGRSAPAARELAERTALPEPGYLIADVGTSVLRGLGPARAEEIEAELDRIWPGEDVVHDRLEDLEAELAPQDVRAPRRVSYWIRAVRDMRVTSGADAGHDEFAARPPEDPSLGPEAAALAEDVAGKVAHRLEDLDVDVVVSANVFLDVLPRGVNKGSTLGRVLRWVGASEDDCVVAGDSLNDLGLFETGMRGIVVGNCEPALRSRVAGMSSVYQAEAEGVAGVLEGLRFHGYFRDSRGPGEDHGE